MTARTAAVGSQARDLSWNRLRSGISEIEPACPQARARSSTLWGSAGLISVAFWHMAPVRLTFRVSWERPMREGARATPSTCAPWWRSEGARQLYPAVLRHWRFLAHSVGHSGPAPCHGVSRGHHRRTFARYAAYEVPNCCWSVGSS